MRKNIFEVSEEEKKRIIKEHIEATKNNYLFESPTGNVGYIHPEKRIIEMLSRKKSADIIIESEGACFYTYWIDNLGMDNLQVIACPGGWLQIRETQDWQGVTGTWEIFDYNDSKWGKVNILGKTFEQEYRPATPTNEGPLFQNVLCAFMTSEEVCKWEFWEDWSWNADDINNLKIQKCNQSEMAKCWRNNPNVKSGKWDSFLDLLPGWW